MGSLSGRIAVLLSIAAVAVVLIAGWLVLVSPERSKAADLQSKIADTQTQLATTEAYVRNPENQRTIKQLRRLKVVLPDDVRMSQVVRQLAAASALAGVRIDGITPAAPVAGAGAESNPIGVVVVGHYFGVSKFLQILRKKTSVTGDSVVGKGRLYSVDSVEFAKGASTTDGGADPRILTVTVALNVYFGAPAPAAAVTPTTP
jgi:hypothetical protein